MIFFFNRKLNKTINFIKIKSKIKVLEIIYFKYIYIKILKLKKLLILHLKLS
jgi:hypothetical protein